MREHTWKLAVGAVVVATALSACGGGESEGDDTGSGSDDAPAASGGSLLLWVGSGTAGEAIKEVAAGFGEENGVEVTTEIVPGDQLQSNFVTASQGNNAPDVVCGAHDWIGNLVQNGAIDPIQLPGTAQETFQPLALQAVTYNGQVYGMPFTMNNIVLYRNTALAPDAPATMEELVAAGEELKSSGDVKEVVAWPVGTTGNPYFINPLYTSGGGYMFGETDDGGFDPADLGVAQPEAVEAYEKIGELGEGGQKVLKRSISSDNALSLFTEGQTAFLVEGPWQLPNLADAGIEYEVSAIPGFEGADPASPFITVDACYVSSKGENKTLAQEYVTNFWSRDDIQKAFYDLAKGVPANVAVLEQIQDSDPDVVAVAEAGAENGQIMPSIPEMAAVWDPLGKAEAAVIAGEDPAATIGAAAKTIEEAIGG